MKCVELDAVLERVEPEARPFLAQRIRELPVTNVVFCRECIHWKKSELVINGARDMVCCFHMGAKYCRHADDFCSKGEKADNE